ncbi:hypothetical protein M5K25_023843 [Dendrobium thyrsiflorum]|uniref:Uncharacterized protein n=1 Tax=Dendrobium thyrsiflorum TaxID=117978 RepID=A0ABD0U0C4_DENTH
MIGGKQTSLTFLRKVKREEEHGGEEKKGDLLGTLGHSSSLSKSDQLEQGDKRSVVLWEGEGHWKTRDFFFFWRFLFESIVSGVGFSASDFGFVRVEVLEKLHESVLGLITVEKHY